MDTTITGSNGNSYSANPTPGATGMNGGVGGDASATSSSTTDTANTAEAYAGSGGNGQDGGPSAVAGQGGGRAGAGGNGGDANAAADVSADSADGNTATATAFGGIGGDGGSGGQPSGLSGVGGNGGMARASASATNTAGAAIARAVSTGGAGGTSQLDTTSGGGGYTGNLYAGGSGGVASNTTAVADGTTSASATAVQTGGAGGTGGSGGNGAASTLTNAVSGATTGGILNLTQEAVGGAGGLGDFLTLGGASGGNAASDLTVSDSSSHTVDTNVEATGGASGSYDDINTGYTDNGYGGSAEATSNLTATDTTNYAGYASTNGYAQALGGEGETGGNANATSNATGNAGISVQAVAQGGYGSSLAGNAIANAAGTAGTTAIVTATARGGSAAADSGTGAARAWAVAVSGQVTANSATEQETTATNQNIQASATTAFLQSALAVSTTSNHGTLSAFDTIDQAVANAAFFPTAASNGTDFGTGDTTLIDMELGGGDFVSITEPTVVTSAVDGAIDLSPYSASSNLLIDLHGAQLVGTGVTGVELVLQGGVDNSIQQIYSFASGSAALSFFSDNVLDFGTIGPLSQSVGGEQLDAELLVTVTNPDSGFYADLQYGIGAAPGTTPPPAGDIFSGTTLNTAAGAYLWSAAANWSAGVPLDGSSATLSTSGRDDIVALGLTTLVSTGMFTAVDGSQLDINTLVSDSATGLEADSEIAGGSATVAVLLGTITGSGGLYVADGANASIEIVAGSEPDEIYQAEDGGRIVLDSLSAGSKFGFVGSGTLALVLPGTTTSAQIDAIAIGDVLELPGTTVEGVSFGANALEVTTSSGIYDFTNVTFGTGVGGFTAGLDAGTGLETITFASPPPPVIFQDNSSATEGEPFNNVYFWSNAGNWAAGALPGNGATVSDTALAGIDDIYQLSLSGFTLGGLLSVIGGNLTLGNILNNGILTAQGNFTGNATITVDGVSSGGDAGYYLADGQGGELIDNVPINSGIIYADGSGLVEINTAPGAAELAYNSSFVGYYNGPGTFALRDPGATIATTLYGVTRQDVLELPGSTVSAVNFGTASLTITTDSGTYDFSDVNYVGSVTGYIAAFDTVTGLEAVTFTGAPPAAADVFYGSVNHSDFPTLTGELWSTDSNWESGVPRNGDAISIEHTGDVEYGGISYPDVSADDIAGLSLSSMAVSSGALVLIYDSLTLGAVNIAAGANVTDQAAVTILGSSVNDGTISTDPTAIIFNGALSGNGTIYISGGSDITFNAAVAAGQTINFLSNTGTLTLNDAAAFDGNIVGTGDIIANGPIADLFSDVSASSGADAGAYLWSNAANWSTGATPASGATVTMSASGTDDIAALNLAALTVVTPAGAADSDGLIVEAGLTVGQLSIDGLSDIEAISSGTSDVVSIGSITVLPGPDGFVPVIEAVGASAVVDVGAASDPPIDYIAYDGGRVELAGAINAASELNFGSGGTYALAAPGSVIDAELVAVAPGSVLELPGSTVKSVNFGASSFTVTTDAGTYDFTDVFYAQGIVNGYTAAIDAATGLEAITFTGPDVFSDDAAVASGPEQGQYLWSNSQNWSGAVPSDGADVAMSGSATDDVAGLSLASLTLLQTSGTLPAAVLSVDTGLTVGALTIGSTSEIFVEGTGGGPTLSIGSIVGSGGAISANGEGAIIDDTGAAEPATKYMADDARIELFGSINAGSELYYGPGAATFALANPGAIISAALIDPVSGDVLELPGSKVDNVVLGSDDSITITTDKGNFAFNNVVYDTGVPPITGYTASFDTATGLEAVTLTGASTEIAVDDSGTTADIENISFLDATPDAIVNTGFLDGNLTVANNGTLTGSSTGVFNSGTIKVFDVQTNEALEGGVDGVANTGTIKVFDVQANQDLSGGTDGVSNAGAVTGGWDIQFNQDLAGGTYGASNTGTVTGGWDVASNAALTGGRDAINNAGTIIGGWDVQTNIDLAGGADGISNSGTVLDGWDVQESEALAIVSHAVALTASSAAETISGGSFGILNTGIVSGGWDISGIDLISGNIDGISNTGSVSGGWTISGIGQISGGIDGISNTATIGGGFSIDNTGTITGITGAGILSTPADITNEAGGIISGATGIVLSDGGSIDNAGTITGTGGTAISVLNGLAFIAIDPGAIFNGQVVDAAGTGTLALGVGTGQFSGIGSSFIGFSNIQVSSGATWTFTGANTITAGQTLADDGTLIVSGSFINNGIVTTDPAVITYESAVTGNGTIEIGAGSDVIFCGSVAATETVEFLSNTGTLTLADPAEFDATVIGSGTEIVICYLRGTRILTPDGQVNVEALQIGDSVMTYFGGVQSIKWIGRQSYARRFVQNNREQLPVRIEAGALGESLPERTLYVSPGHSMLIEDTLILAKSLVNGLTITQHDAPEEIHYYQIELEAHDCVLAEGAWSETYADSEGMRNKFHNARTFYALYPDYRAPAEPQLCAPRPQSGAALEEVLRPIVLRASTDEVPGALLGWIEDIGEDAIKGWAQDAELLELPVLLEVLIGEQVVHTILACDYRRDLAEAGIGQGRCSFLCKLAADIPPDSLGDVWIRRAADGAALPYSQELQGRLDLHHSTPQAGQKHSPRESSFRGGSQSR